MRQWGFARLILLGSLLLLGLTGLLAGCSKPAAIGPIDNSASLALLRFEAIDPETSGVVYRRIQNFPALIAQARTPVLLVFYQPMDPVNTRVIPRIEQLADELQDELAIVWIDATVETKLASDFQVGQLPQFTMLVDAAVKRSLIGYGDQSQVQLDQLIESYRIP